MIQMNKIADCKMASYSKLISVTTANPRTSPWSPRCVAASHAHINEGLNRALNMWAIRILLQWRLANRTSWVDLRWLSNGLSVPNTFYVCIRKNVAYCIIQMAWPHRQQIFSHLQKSFSYLSDENLPTFARTLSLARGTITVKKLQTADRVIFGWCNFQSESWSE